MKRPILSRLTGAIKGTPKPAWEPHWQRHGDSWGLYSDDKYRSRVMFMRIGVWGEIVVKFEDGRETCVWPTGEIIAPHTTGLTRHAQPVHDDPVGTPTKGEYP